MLVENPIPLRIVHSDPFARAGLAGSLARFTDFSMAPGHAGDEVVIADIDSAMALARSARRNDPGFPSIVIVSGPDRERELRQALESRIRGYLIGGFSLDELADSVRAVHRGARYLCPRAASRLAESVYFSALTDREEAVLDLVVQGLCNKAVARQLGIALGTVKSHLKSAYGKLSVASRTQAALASERRGLLPRRSTGQHASAHLS